MTAQDYRNKINKIVKNMDDEQLLRCVLAFLLEAAEMEG